MKKKVFGIFACLLVVAMLTVLLSVVFAKQTGIVVEGVLYRSGVIFDVNRELPHGYHRSGTVSHMYTGDFYGPAEGELVYNIHYQGGPPGGTVRPGATISGRNFETITVLQFLGESASGTITMLWSVSNKQWRIISGTEDFENIHGSGTWEPDDSTADPFDHLYSGTVYFEP